MSIEHMADMLDLALPAIPKFVAVMLADQSDMDGGVTFDPEWMARRCGLSAAQFDRALDHLVRAGHIGFTGRDERYVSAVLYPITPAARVPV